MHELSLCRAIADTAIRAAEGRSVTRVAVRVGHFRQVVPTALQQCWDMRTPGGVLDNCALDVEYVPAVIECAACGVNSKLAVPVLRCAACGSSEVKLISGEEFLVLSIDVESATDDQVGHRSP